MLGQLTQEEIKEILKNNFIGRIGTHDGEKVYVVPISYIYDNGDILCHSREGMKVEMMRHNPEICFEVDEIRDFANWKSIIAWGTFEELTEEKDLEYAKQFFTDYMLTMKVSETARPPHDAEMRPHQGKPSYTPTVFYRIKMKHMTGRFEKNT